MTENGELLWAVRDAWAETLGIEAASVPLEEGFFEAGGNSLLLLLLWEQLNELTSRDLRATDLFLHPTVRAQAALLLSPDGDR
ncbi:acyl carrier protein [Actinoallomurus sp. CA-142502]|uniref:acyl carrier protein n=1 Tax=Actinoallomurus sp. CA-142502 TaxID=3239885 RepID=UPI003D93DE8A